jgi:putative ABC transport system permease protein
VVGSNAAERLRVGPGDSLVSSPESLFDLAGAYPLKMHVAGVLAPSYSPDDDAVFVDLKTAWVIEGLGHGHQDLTNVTDPGVVLQSDETSVTAGAKLVQYNEITDANIDSFHFHGDMDTFPVSALLVVPNDQKSEDLLRGRYLEDERYVLVRPVEIVRGLLSTIFRIEGALQAAFLLMGVGAALLIALVVMLSLRLREREMKTLYKLGCSRGKIAGIIGSELGLIALGCLVLTGALALATAQYAEVILKSLVF